MTVADQTEIRCGLRARFGSRRVRPRRRGTVLSIELLLVAPILLILLLALIEFGLLWSADHRVKAASQVACRIATLPAGDPEALRQEMLAATSRIMQHPTLIKHHRVSLKPGTYSGDPVIVEVRLPMQAAAPDLLRIVGLKLAGRELAGRTVMRKE